MRSGRTRLREKQETPATLQRTQALAAGTGSIDDMDLLRHGAMSPLVEGVRAPSTLGTFLRSVKFGHARQLDAVRSRLLIYLAQQARRCRPVATSWLCRRGQVESWRSPPQIRWIPQVCITHGTACLFAGAATGDALPFDLGVSRKRLLCSERSDLPVCC